MVAIGWTAVNILMSNYLVGKGLRRGAREGVKTRMSGYLAGLTSEGGARGWRATRGGGPEATVLPLPVLTPGSRSRSPPSRPPPLPSGPL
jgi:hypothetical protein